MGYIYKITNLINNKIYIGQTTRSVEVRWKEHLRSKDEYPIHKAIRKYGEENFTIEEIEKCEDNDLLNEREKYYISYYQSYNGNKGYNASPGGSDNTNLINWVKTHPEEIKQHLNNIRPIAMKYFEDNPQAKKEREEKRMEGYKKYITNNKEKWLETQRKNLEKARETLKKQYEEDPTEIIKRAQENGAKTTSKAVYQIDIETNLIINEFKSCAEASRFLNKNGGHSNISKACKSGKICYGYKWAYIN